MGVTLRHLLDMLRLYFPWLANQEKETQEAFLMGAGPEVKEGEGSREREREI